MKALLVLALAAVGCGDITTTEDALMTPDGGAQGTGGAMNSAGTGGHVVVAGTGGSPVVAGTGGTPPVSYPFCAPTETLSVDSAICQKLDPGGTYSNRTKDGHVCAICDPAATGMGITNLPCLYDNHLCTHGCEGCN